METITIKIAPSMDEVKLDGRTLSTEFNGLLIEYTYPDCVPLSFCEEHELTLRGYLRDAIALSSKPWQLEYLMNGSVKIDGKEVQGTFKETRIC